MLSAAVAVPAASGGHIGHVAVGNSAPPSDEILIFGELKRPNPWASSMFSTSYIDHGIGARVTCSEVGFAVRKGVVLEQWEVVSKLLKPGLSGFDARKLTNKRNMPVSEAELARWDLVSPDAMRNADWHKFAGNPELRTTLLSTAGKRLVEAVDFDLVSRGQPGVWSAGITREQLEQNIASKAQPLFPGENRKGRSVEAARDFFADRAAFDGYSHYEYSVDAGVTWCGPWPAAAMVAYLRAGQLSGDGVRVRPAELRAVDEWRRQRAAAASSGGAAEPKADG